MIKKKISILGIRGIPARHGGFETFAEKLAVYLTKRGWSVSVYCQESQAESSMVYESVWEGIRRIHIPVNEKGALGTVFFDFKSILHNAREEGLVLTLGYNTAFFNGIFRWKGKKNIINMDGIEWKRNKWKWYEQAWLYLNERAGCLLGDHLIADHPEIARHLFTRVPQTKVTMIPYGARKVVDADQIYLSRYGLSPGGYAIVVARPEPENSILEIVKAFSAKKRNHRLVILGNYQVDNEYHQRVKTSASDEVTFVGAVYDHAVVDALRFWAALYIHGHTVGGTNPSLVEALGAGQPILAHDNKFNRWVSGAEAKYFSTIESCERELDRILTDQVLAAEMRIASRKRFQELFTWDAVLGKYESLLMKWASSDAR